jgi:hypothetical protein
VVSSSLSSLSFCDLFLRGERRGHQPGLTNGYKRIPLLFPLNIKVILEKFCFLKDLGLWFSGGNPSDITHNPGFTISE